MGLNGGNRNIFVALSLIIFTSCDNGAHPTEPPSETQERGYFPLTVGNEWHYKAVEAQSWSVSVTSKVKANEKEYFVLTSGQVLRAKQGVIYRRVDDREYLYLDFTRSLGDEWEQSPYQRYAFVASRTDSVLTEAGHFENCAHIISDSDLDRSEEWYALGIGLVASHVQLKRGVVMDGYSQLYSAMIDGKGIP